MDTKVHIGCKGGPWLRNSNRSLFGISQNGNSCPTLSVIWVTCFRHLSHLPALKFQDLLSLLALSLMHLLNIFEKKMSSVIAKPKLSRRKSLLMTICGTKSRWTYSHQSQYEDIIKTRNNNVINEMFPFAADNKCVLHGSKKTESSSD